MNYGQLSVVKRGLSHVLQFLHCDMSAAALRELRHFVQRGNRREKSKSQRSSNDLIAHAPEALISSDEQSQLKETPRARCYDYSNFKPKAAKRRRENCRRRPIAAEARKNCLKAPSVFSAPGSDEAGDEHQGSAGPHATSSPSSFFSSSSFNRAWPQKNKGFDTHDRRMQQRVRYSANLQSLL